MEDLGSPSPGVGLHTRTSPIMPSMTHTEMHAGFACRARENAGVPDRLRRRRDPGPVFLPWCPPPLLSGSLVECLLVLLLGHAFLLAVTSSGLLRGSV